MDSLLVDSLMLSSILAFRRLLFLICLCLWVQFRFGCYYYFSLCCKVMSFFYEAPQALPRSPSPGLLEAPQASSKLPQALLEAPQALLEAPGSPRSSPGLPPCSPRPPRSSPSSPRSSPASSEAPQALLEALPYPPRRA